VQALKFWKAVIVDRTDFLERVIALLQEEGIRFCLVGGQAVNAYAEPVVSLDLDIAIAVEDFSRAESLLRASFNVREFPHGLNVGAPGSDLQVQLQKDPRYFDFVRRSQPRVVLGLSLPVASLEDVLQGRGWAAQDPARRPSKRQKDLADIARLLKKYPPLKDRVPAEILGRLY
jgi:hypothetical protein